MTTFGDVIERTRRRLMTAHREPLNTLSAAVTAADTSFTFDNAVRFADGARLSVGLEDVYVVQVTGSGAAATVIRGSGGSTAAAHNSGSIVHINPTWTNFEIGQAVNDELAALSAPTIGGGLFRVRSAEFDYTASRSGYNLSGLTDFLDVWRVRYDTPGPEHDWPVLPRSMWRIDHAADTTDFADGVQLVLKHGGWPGHTVRVSYKASFTPMSALTDDVETDAGLHPQAHDILSLGAAIRLLSGYEAQRTYSTAQPNPRRAEDVPARASISALVPLVEQREERVREEVARLARLYPEAIL